MRPVATLTTPVPLGPAMDGFAITEFRLLVPRDGPPGLTFRWQPTSAGMPIGPEESMALAEDEMGDTAAFEAALMAYLAQVLHAKGRSVARVERGAEPVTVAPKVTETPFVRLG